MTSTVVKFIYDLPYKSRLELCNILDFNNDWKTLGGNFMAFDCYELFKMEQAVLRRGSPTDELLSSLGAQNHTVLKLFKQLHAMKHYRAMTVLKPYVDPKYHICIPEGNVHDRTIQPTPLEVDRNGNNDAGMNINEPSGEPNVKIPPPQVKEINIGNQPTRKVSDPLTPNPLGGTPHIAYQELTLATDNWNKLNILGRGGFGTVYKGLWKNTPIAVKKLEVQKNGKSEETLNQCQREQSMRELKYLNSCRHDNILPLFGISFESGKYCLVYQFMANGSLEDRLQMKKQTPPLLWSERLQIAKGTALGLQFLHSQDPPLIHGDIKSANILLNAHMQPVIGDFGLTQEGPIEKATHITLKRVNGTRPYLPEEFIVCKLLSTKVDVYGFGIVLFEIATGMRAYDENRKSHRLLKTFVESYPEEKLFDLVDKYAQPIDRDIALSFLKIGKQSVVIKKDNRPEMIKIFNLLCEHSPGTTTPAMNIPTYSSVCPSPLRIIPPNIWSNNLPRYKFPLETRGKPLETRGKQPYIVHVPQQSGGSQYSEVPPGAGVPAFYIHPNTGSHGFPQEPGPGPYYVNVNDNQKIPPEYLANNNYVRVIPKINELQKPNSGQGQTPVVMTPQHVLRASGEKFVEPSAPMESPLPPQLLDIPENSRDQEDNSELTSSVTHSYDETASSSNEETSGTSVELLGKPGGQGEPEVQGGLVVQNPTVEIISKESLPQINLLNLNK